MDCHHIGLSKMYAYTILAKFLPGICPDVSPTRERARVVLVPEHLHPDLVEKPQRLKVFGMAPYTLAVNEFKRCCLLWTVVPEIPDIIYQPYVNLAVKALVERRADCRHSILGVWLRPVEIASVAD
jgi:hypothetical protein